MKESPITKTLSEMLAKLQEAVIARREAQQQVAEYTSAIKALAQVCEDEEIKTEYLLRLEEFSGKSGFVDAVRSILRTHPDSEGLTPTQIRSWIVISKNMDLSGYSNPMASIHTTLRRMRESDEVEEVRNKKGEKSYRLKRKSLRQLVDGKK